MAKRTWKSFRPISLQDAFEACTQFAVERHNRSIDRIAELMGLPSKWVLYKWIADGRMPAVLVPAFEHACGCHFVTQHLASSARKLLIDVPTGRGRKAGDHSALMACCNDAVNALIAFDAGRLDAPSAIAATTNAIEQLAAERADVEHHTQPDLGLA